MIDSRVRVCATKLSDTALLAKLAMSMSDMHVLDAKYYKNFLIGLYNRIHSHQSNSKGGTSHTNSASVEALALVELMSNTWKIWLKMTIWWQVLLKLSD